MLRKWTQQKDFSRKTEKRRREMQLLQRSRVSNGRKLSIREYPILRKDNLKLAELRPYKILRIKRAPMEEKIPQPHPFVQRPQLRKCEIAKEVWRIKDQGGNYQIRWEIVGHAPGYNPITRKCRLCTAEKLLIAEDPDPRLLNKRDELVSKCRHRRKHALELC